MRVHLAPQEGLVMTALLSHREVTAELLMEVLWPDPDDMPDTWHDILKILLSRLRHNLRAFGWVIKNRHGFGWHLVEPNEKRLAA